MEIRVTIKITLEIFVLSLTIFYCNWLGWDPFVSTRIWLKQTGSPPLRGCGPHTYLAKEDSSEAFNSMYVWSESNQWEWCTSPKKVSQIDESGAVGVRHSAAELLFFLKSRLPPIDFTHFLLKINKFAKSPSSRAGRPRFGFLVVNSVIKDQKWTL